MLLATLDGATRTLCYAPAKYVDPDLIFPSCRLPLNQTDTAFEARNQRSSAQESRLPFENSVVSRISQLTHRYHEPAQTLLLIQRRQTEAGRGREVQQPETIIAELEEAVRSGSSEKRVNTLRQVTNLFLYDGERLNETQIKIFDDVLCLLVARVETRVRAELSERLAPIDYAPADLIQRLAGDDEIAVAGHVLAHSSRLTTNTLVEIANTKGQDHLLAISGRANLPEMVTDVIVNRGETRVIRKLAGNVTARFSDIGYSTMVSRAESDDELTELLGLRFDLPIRYLRDLLQRATEAVRTKLMAIAPPEIQEQIAGVLRTIVAAAPGNGARMRDFTRAEESVKRMKGLNELTGAAITRFAEAGKFDEVAAALGLLNNLPTAMIMKVIEGDRHDLVLIPCKSAGLDWKVVEAILTHRPIKHGIDQVTLKIANKDYGKLSLDTAQRTLRFWLVHNKVAK
jgi:uncharacterized protein (DUF2336 family)